MSYIIRTAAVTQKSANKEFNDDNLNLNGKVLSMENADKGFKGAGSMNVPFAVAFASSDYNGFAGAALTALNDRFANLKADENGFASIINDYFADSQSALEKCGCDSKGLATALLVGYENRIVAAKMGDVCILRYANGDLAAIGSAEETSGCSCDVVGEINNGDLYVLCSANVLDSLTEGEIIVALNAADGNEKKAVQMLASKYAKRNPDANVTFTVVRVIKEVQEPVVPAAMPEVQSEEPAYPADEQPEENVYEPENEEDYEEEPANPRKKLLLWAILCVALVLIMAATGFAAYKISYARNHSDVAAGVVAAGGDAQYDVNTEAATEEPTSEEATDEAATEEATEEATEAPTEETTEDDDDDYYYDDDDDDDYYYDDDYDNDNGYYDDEDVTTVEPVTRPVENEPTAAPDNSGNDDSGSGDAGSDDSGNGDSGSGDAGSDEPTPEGPVEAPEDNTFTES